MMINRKTGDLRVIVIQKSGLCNMVIQVFSETMQEGYNPEVPHKEGNYWLTKMPVRIDFECEVMEKVRKEFSVFFSERFFQNAPKNYRFVTEFVIPKSGIPYFSIPVIAPNSTSSIFCLNIKGSLTDIEKSKSYSINQLEQNKLWAVTKSELIMFSDKNNVQYLFDTQTTSMLRGKVIVNPDLEKILISSIKQLN